MSDRLAVFNAGRIEQLGTPAEVYERPGDALRGRVRRDLEPADRRRRRRRSSADAGTFTIRPEKIRLAEPDDGRRPTTSRRRPGASATSSTSGRTRATSSTLDAGRRARRHPAEPGDDLDRGARPGRQGCPPHLEATARAPRRGRGGRSWRRRSRHEASEDPGAGRDGGRWPSRPVAAAAAASAGPEPADRPSWARAKASSTSSSGPATPSAARSTRPSTGSPRSRTKTGCKVNTTDMTDSNNGVSLMQSGDYDGGSFSGDATDAPDGRWHRGPGQHGPASRTTPTSSRASRTSPTTRSTACPTACRTAAVRTCSCTTPTSSRRRRRAGTWSGTAAPTATARSASTTRRSTSPTRRCT